MSPTRVNMSQHESDTSPTRVNTNQHESDTSQHESTQVNMSPTRVNTSPTRVWITKNTINLVKQNINVTYQWCFPEKYVEGWICQWFNFYLKYLFIKHCVIVTCNNYYVTDSRFIKSFILKPIIES